ncbi:MAG: amino acid deaminase/aldolase [Halobacteriovoraceae bacterium]|jgi:D-serine deaminase-like pyridoxal phosphate-dependent protein|nr:amino acid deaminase/aldolase [Halobacteriovoraceae bacterium]MBT5093648.1 amino acid deaminase/aldolase [Halobacteriovoraceae bacterium]
MGDQLYKTYKKALSGFPMPLAYLDMDFLEININQILKRAGKKKIRIASKSIRCREILKYLLESNPELIEGLMCFTAQEATWLSKNDFDNLLVAYPSYKKEAIFEICSEVKKGKKIYLMADCLEHLKNYQRIAAEADAVLPLCLDIDMSLLIPGLNFGVFRSPLRNDSQVVELVQFFEANPNIKLAGIMGYEAQLAGVVDKSPYQKLLNGFIRLLKWWSRRDFITRRQEIVQYCEQKLGKLEFVNGGGTGSMEITRQDSSVTEIAVGSGFYSPVLFDYYRDFQHQPAAGFAIEVVRKPRAHMVTCLGGGYVASGGLSRDKIPQPYLPNGCALTQNELAGEVQTPILYSGVETLNLGDPVFMRHSKAGELCERFNHLHLIKKGEHYMTVPTYRGEGQAFC